MDLPHQPTLRGNAAEAINAPLFASMIEQLDDEQRHVILDLGPARNATIALFGRFRSHLEVADIAQDFAKLDPEPEPAEVRPLVATMLPAPIDELAGFVFCWDLLNYLRPPILAALMANVATRCAPGAMVHALITYSSPKMTREPGDFVPLDHERLIMLNRDEPRRDATRYSPENLNHYLPGYTIDRGRLLRNGMQEFLFRVRPRRQGTPGAPAHR